MTLLWHHLRRPFAVYSWANGQKVRKEKFFLFYTSLPFPTPLDTISIYITPELWGFCGAWYLFGDWVYCFDGKQHHLFQLYMIPAYTSREVCVAHMKLLPFKDATTNLDPFCTVLGKGFKNCQNLKLWRMQEQNISVQIVRTIRRLSLAKNILGWLVAFNLGFVVDIINFISFTCNKWAAV